MKTIIIKKILLNKGIKLSSNRSKSCSKKSSFSESWDQAFSDCCEENVNRKKNKKKAKPAKTKATTATTVTTDTTEDEEFNDIFKEITYPTFSTQGKSKAKPVFFLNVWIQIQKDKKFIFFVFLYS